jgi:hypothetical protein
MLQRFLLIVIGITGSGAFVLIGEEPATPQIYTAAQAAAGQAAYQSTCIKCHTDTLMGRKGDANEMPPLSSLPVDMQKTVKAAGGKVPPLAGVNFLSRWSGRTTKDLSIRIKDAVGGFPPEGANEETGLNITAYVLEANGAKAGSDALTWATAAVIGSVAKGVAQPSTAAGIR